MTDEAAFRAYAAARRLFPTTCLLCGDPHRAEYVAQDALTRLYGVWDRVARMDTVDAYVRRIIVNAHYRDRRRRVHRNRGVLSGAVALGLAGVVLTASLVTGGDRDTRPGPAFPSPTEVSVGSPTGTTTTTATTNGQITSVQRHLGAEASDYQWRAFNSAADTGLFVSGGPGDELESLTVVGPAGPVSTLACSEALPCPPGEDWSGYAATLGPGADEVTVESGDRTLQVLGYDGTVRRTLDLTASLDFADDIRKLAWSPDGSRLAVATALDIWLVKGDVVTHPSTSGRIWNLGGWSPDGKSLLVDRYAGQTGADVVVLGPTSEGTPATTPQTLYRSDRHFDWAGNVAWSPDGTRIAVRTESAIVEISAEDGRVLARHPHIGGWVVWPSTAGDES